MKILVSFLLLLCLNQKVYAQVYLSHSEAFDCSDVQISMVTAESGLNLRAGPSVDSEKIRTLPKNTKVLSCHAGMGPEQVVNGVKGRWIRAKHNELEGFLFSAYLQRKSCEDEGIRLIIPGDHSVDNFPTAILCDPYQGIFKQATDNKFVQRYDVRPVSLVDTTIDYRMKYMGFLSDQAEKPLFLISGLDIQVKQIEGKWIKKMYFPFQGETIWVDQQNRTEPAIDYMVFADGVGVKSEDADSAPMFSGIKQYQLWLRRYQSGKPVKDLLLFEADLNHFVGTQYEGGAWIYWVGDLNQDNIPDLILKTATHYACWGYKLFLSSPSSKEKMYQMLDVGGGCGC